MTTNSLRIAMGQMAVEPGQAEKNLTTAVRMIGEASEQGCQVIVLPECMDLGWTYADAAALALPIPGDYSDRLCNAAKEYQIYIVAGLTERSGDKLYNAAVLIDPNGDIILKYHKINELSIAENLYAKGGSLAVAETPLGTIGVNICADNWPPHNDLGHALGMMGTKLLLSPSSWAVRPEHSDEEEYYGLPWQNSYMELAKRSGMTVIGVSNVGPVVGGAWDGWKCIGCSLAVGSDGEVLVRGPYGEQAEELIVVEVSV
ncbi:carbon-nitrogen hydrolase family protein [Paenibacillus sp. GCM10023252]|uniref:carbon-nitrogen hydrolase family protein n=1 Tax=Paenibacillus sp. GCM10023252 TaxID=3252649 RepID=UPI00360C56EA